jgi:hydroxysqualene dehydroxylase
VTRHVHVIGAGLAGLSAAVRLSEKRGIRVTVWEATGRPGGRCWSFCDPVLDRCIDNGNHLILSGNTAVLDYAKRIGAGHLLSVRAEAAFPFVDLGDGRRWTVRIPTGLRGAFCGKTNLHGAGPGLLIDAIRLLSAGRRSTVAGVLSPRGRTWHDYWMPLSMAVLNMPPERASAQLLAAVLRQTVLRGGQACRPVFAAEGLTAALVNPAVALLRRRRVEFRWRTPLVRIDRASAKVQRLHFGTGEAVELAKDDFVIVAALPASVAGISQALPGPGLTILNAHYSVAPEIARRVPPMIGVISGAAHWIFRRGDVLSVTVSAAESTPLAGLPREAILDRLWQDIARVAGCGDGSCLARRLVRERQATWDQSPDGVARRPELRTGHSNLVLAGDYVRNRLPATLECAVLSGSAAADHVA